ncbi:hypothetical protein ACWCPM_34175 [Streptomyces sp. NPDC002309]
MKRQQHERLASARSALWFCLPRPVKAVVPTLSASVTDDRSSSHNLGPFLLEIVAIVVKMNMWTRIKLAEGAMPGPAECE